MAGIKKSIEKSKGKIICLMDSDDFFKKNKVKEIVNFSPTIQDKKFYLIALLFIKIK